MQIIANDKTYKPVNLLKLILLFFKEKKHIL